MDIYLTVCIQSIQYTCMRKMIPVSLETHAWLSVARAKKMVREKGRKVTFDEIINDLKN